MRAVVYDGRRARPVELPIWVVLDVAALVVRCDRCEASARLGDLGRAEAERGLGRFAQWHKRCRERAAYVPLKKYERWEPPPKVTFVRRKG